MVRSKTRVLCGDTCALHLRPVIRLHLQITRPGFLVSLTGRGKGKTVGKPELGIEKVAVLSKMQNVMD